ASGLAISLINGCSAEGLPTSTQMSMRNGCLHHMRPCGRNVSEAGCGHSAVMKLILGWYAPCAGQPLLLSFRSLEMSKSVTREQSRRRPTEARCEVITSDDRMPVQG